MLVAHDVSSLLRAQGLCGIELTGAPCWDDAGAGGGDREDDDDDGEDAPVEGAHAVEHGAQELDGGCAARESDEKADRYRCEAVGQCETHDLRALRAERDTDAEFGGALGNKVREHAVETDSG